MPDPTVNVPWWEFTVQVSDKHPDYFLGNEMVIVVEAKLPALSNPDGLNMPACRIGAWAPVTREMLDDPEATKAVTRMLAEQIYDQAVEQFRYKPPQVDRHPRVTKALAWWDRETDSLRRVSRAGRHR